jgi:hypothetical protein
LSLPLPSYFVSFFEYHFWAQITHEQNRSKLNLAHLPNTVVYTRHCCLKPRGMDYHNCISYGYKNTYIILL